MPLPPSYMHDVLAGNTVSWRSGALAYIDGRLIDEEFLRENISHLDNGLQVIISLPEVIDLNDMDMDYLADKYRSQGWTKIESTVVEANGDQRKLCEIILTHENSD